MTYRSIVIACNLDWQRVLNYHENNSPNIESIVSSSTTFRLGIYECYKHFFGVYGDHKKTFSRIRELFTTYLSNPMENSLTCANFTSNEEILIATLSRACNSLRNQTTDDDEKRIEHTILVYIMKLLEDKEGFTDIPKVRLCSGNNCPFGAHQ